MVVAPEFRRYLFVLLVLIAAFIGFLTTALVLEAREQARLIAAATAREEAVDAAQSVTAANDLYLLNEQIQLDQEINDLKADLNKRSAKRSQQVQRLQRDVKNLKGKQ